MATKTTQDRVSRFPDQMRAVVGDTVAIAVALDLHTSIFDQVAGLIRIAVRIRYLRQRSPKNNTVEGIG